MAIAELSFLKKAVLGKTGNDDAEGRLFDLWGGILEKTNQMIANKPSVIRQLADRATIFATDFWQGAKDAMKGYAEWAVRQATPVLKQFYEASNRVIIAKQSLKKAKAAGRITPVAAAAEEAKIAESEGQLNTIRATFKNMTDASLDTIVQDEIGPYQRLDGIVLPLVIVGALAALAYMVKGAYDGIMQRLDPLLAQTSETIEQAKRTLKEVEERAKEAAPLITQAGGAIVEGKTKIEELMPYIIGGIVLITGSLVYYLVFRKRRK